MALDQRGAMLHLRPDMASLATGSCNFPTIVYENPPDFVWSLAIQMRELGVRPEIEVFDLAMLYNAADLVSDGIIGPRPHVQFVMGVRHALPARRDVLNFEVAKLRELLPGVTFTAAGIGRHQMEVARWSLELGGHVRTGLEDNIRLDRTTLAPSNAALVRLAVELCQVHGRRVASAAEARRLLGLKPGRRSRREGRLTRSNGLVPRLHGDRSGAPAAALHLGSCGCLYRLTGANGQCLGTLELRSSE